MHKPNSFSLLHLHACVGAVLEATQMADTSQLPLHPRAVWLQPPEPASPRRLLGSLRFNPPLHFILSSSSFLPLDLTLDVLFFYLC